MAFDLLETLRWTPREGWYLFDRHLDRLERSARHFGFDCSRAEILHALSQAVQEASGACRVRLLLDREGHVRVEPTPFAVPRGAMRVRLAAQPIDPTDIFLYHKTTNRSVYERARLPDCDDVILWNPSGEATESTIANLVVQVGGRRVTPPVACGLLPGTMRAELLARGEIHEEVVKVDELGSAARFWLVNSVRGWCDAALIDKPQKGRAID
jgi:branched-subunit amino acid aminotransferase/4-amino-4-deoxychorismate lyase